MLTTAQSSKTDIDSADCDRTAKIAVLRVDESNWKCSYQFDDEIETIEVGTSGTTLTFRMWGYVVSQPAPDHLTDEKIVELLTELINEWAD